MKTKAIMTFLVVLIMCSANSVLADTVWTEGHHEINDGDVYGEIWIYNDCTLDIFGGDITQLYSFDIVLTNWYDGQIKTLVSRENSIINIYGGISLNGIGADGNGLFNLYSSFSIPGISLHENSVLNLYAYDVIHHPTGGQWNDGCIEGYYIIDDTYFSIDIAGDSFSHINIIPEPTTILLLGLGSLIGIIRRK